MPFGFAVQEERYGRDNGADQLVFFTEAFTTDPPSFIKSLKSRTTPFSPPGVLTTSYVHTTPSRQIQTIEIWRTSLADPACRALVDNMQILVSLYIEGGTPLDLEDEDWVNKRWEVFFLYAKDSSSSSGNGPAYNFIGYCTLYRHFYFHKTNNNLSRTRLSQFLVLPPYQKQGHGAKFYSAIVDHYMAIPEVVELTVEDPSEPFADLRDLCDLARIRRDPDFKALQLTDIAKLGLAEVTEPLRKKHKMPKRQFYRTLELELLSRLDKRKKREYKQYRLFVKKRIYMQNADVLSQLDRLEKIDKLEETYIHVEDDYYRLLKAAKTRKLELVEEEDGDENGDDRDDGLEKRAAKRQRI